MKWKFIRNEGIESVQGPGIILRFNTPREAIRQLLGYKIKTNKGRFDDEDSYRNVANQSDNWIRLGFEHGILCEIEILEGSIEIEGETITIFGNLEQSISALKRKGFIFSPGEYSWTDKHAKIDLGDSGLNGGVPNQVRWFFTAISFD